MRTIMHHPSGGNSKTPLVSVFDGDGVCRGFILNRGKLGFEIFDVEQRSLGTYPTQRAAADALSLVKEGVS